jgi:hypothetical protein
MGIEFGFNKTRLELANPLGIRFAPLINLWVQKTTRIRLLMGGKSLGSQVAGTPPPQDTLSKPLIVCVIYLVLRTQQNVYSMCTQEVLFVPRQR